MLNIIEHDVFLKVFFGGILVCNKMFLPGMFLYSLERQANKPIFSQYQAILLFRNTSYLMSNKVVALQKTAFLSKSILYITDDSH